MPSHRAWAVVTFHDCPALGQTFAKEVFCEPIIVELFTG